MVDAVVDVICALQPKRADIVRLFWGLIFMISAIGMMAAAHNINNSVKENREISCVNRFVNHDQYDERCQPAIDEFLKNHPGFPR